MNNLNCHVEPKRQLRAETSRQIHISPRDIAENTKLNHEITEELRKHAPNHSSSSSRHPEGVTRGSRSNKDSLATWILRSSRSMTRMYVLLSILTLLPTLAQAETCTATPDCKSLGYTETSCPDNNGVRCPWNTSLWFCNKNDIYRVKKCEIGDVLFADKKCYECFPGESKDLPHIGVVCAPGKAVNLIEMTTPWVTEYSELMKICSNYKIENVSGWYVPSYNELVTLHSNISLINPGLIAAGGTKISNEQHCASEISNCNNTACKDYNPIIDTVLSNGFCDDMKDKLIMRVRCFLSF